MMLWYKLWRESRVRFLLFAVTLCFLCVNSLNLARTAFPPPDRPYLPCRLRPQNGLPSRTTAVDNNVHTGPDHRRFHCSRGGIHAAPGFLRAGAAALRFPFLTKHRSQSPRGEFKGGL